MKNTLKNERINWIDNCKGLALFFVVLSHLNLHAKVNVFLSAWYSYFYVPLFFVVAGYVFKIKPLNKTFKDFLISKVKRLLVPFYAFSFLYWAEQILFKLIAKRDVKSYILTNWPNLINGNGGGVLWFLFCLFFAEIVFYFVLKVNQKWIQFVLLIIAAGMGLYVPMFIAIRRILIGVAFLTAGYLFGCLKLNKKQQIIFVILLSAVHIIGANINGYTGLYNASFGKSSMLYFLIANVACFSLISIFMLINKKLPFLTYLGKESMIIYCVHMPIAEFLWVINGQFLHWSWLDSATTVVVLFVCVPVVAVLKRWFPWSIGVRKRG